MLDKTCFEWASSFKDVSRAFQQIVLKSMVATDHVSLVNPLCQSLKHTNSELFFVCFVNDIEKGPFLEDRD